MGSLDVYQYIRKAYADLTRPFFHSPQAEITLKIRYISTFTLISILLATLFLIIRVYTLILLLDVSQFNPILFNLIILGTLFIIYFISRTNYYRVSIYYFIVNISVCSFFEYQYLF